MDSWCCQRVSFPLQPPRSKTNCMKKSAPYIASAALGCWLSDPFNNWFGRRGCIFGSAVFCTIAPIGSAVSQTWEQLFVTRLLLGLGMGMKASTIPIFCAENTPASIRGGLVMSWQLYGTPSTCQYLFKFEYIAIADNVTTDGQPSVFFLDSAPTLLSKILVQYHGVFSSVPRLSLQFPSWLASISVQKALVGSSRKAG